MTALKPLMSEQREEATAFKRDYEERARGTGRRSRRRRRPRAPQALFSDAAAHEAAEAKKLAAARRSQAMMQGYTGNECLGVPQLHHGAERHLREVRHLRRDERVQLTPPS